MTQKTIMGIERPSSDLIKSLYRRNTETEKIVKTYEDSATVEDFLNNKKVSICVRIKIALRPEFLGEMLNAAVREITYGGEWNPELHSASYFALLSAVGSATAAYNRANQDYAVYNATIRQELDRQLQLVLKWYKINQESWTIALRGEEEMAALKGDLK